MTKKRKKYNPSLKFQSLSKALAKRYKLAFIYGVDKKVIPFYDDKEIKNWSMTEARMLAEVRHKWTILTGAICRDVFKKTYIKSREFSVDVECLSNELESVLNFQQAEMLLDVNKSQLLTVFWIARPVKDYEFSEAEIWQVINASKVENELMTPYEYEQWQKEKING